MEFYIAGGGVVVVVTLIILLNIAMKRAVCEWCHGTGMIDGCALIYDVREYAAYAEGSLLPDIVNVSIICPRCNGTGRKTELIDYDELAAAERDAVYYAVNRGLEVDIVFIAKHPVAPSVK